MHEFRNSYLIMRHGESEANVAGVIVSNPDIGCSQYGLSETGRLQASESAQLHHASGITKIVCSDFLRTQQTAEIVQQQLGLPDVQIDEGLRERYFGVWDGDSHTHYQNVWRADGLGGVPEDQQVESASAVLERGLGVLSRLEASLSDETILLVSHGDMLQILRTAFLGVSPFKHRDLAHHETGEVKPLVAKGESYPLDRWLASA
ncbi:MAG TPA: histidine phosphatase family protein [Marinobacterium sp.]|nr:histidine phosphatase family protein [Marinobacterium sp.]